MGLWTGALTEVMAVGQEEEGKFPIFLIKHKIVNDVMVTFWFNSLKTGSANLRIFCREYHPGKMKYGQWEGKKDGQEE